MKSLKLIILTLAILFLTNNLESYTNKTYLLPRSAGVNLALESTTFYELLQLKNDYEKYEPIKDKIENPFLASFQFVPFYSESTNKNDLGAYFGIHNSKLITFKEQDPDMNQLNLLYIIHDSDAGIADYYASIELNPERENLGLFLNSYHDLEKIFKGLYFKVNMPIVHVKNSINLKTFQENVDPNSKYKAGVITSYFSGIYEKESGALNSQTALTQAKIYGDHSKTRIADIDLILGYRLLDEINKYFKVNIGLTLPTGNKPKGEFLFEPICGNGHHWALGLGLDSSFTLWDDNKDQNIKLSIVANYRYLFNGTEKRTLGIKDFDYGQYYCIGKNGDSFATPAANILTQDVKVDPKNQLDAIGMFTYNNGNLTCDLGYNLFWKSAESISVKNWQNDVYGIIADFKDFSVGPLDVNEKDNWYEAKGFNNAKINQDRLDTDAASTPSYLTHKIYAGIGYIFRDAKKVPVLLGLGGSYEFAPKNNELEYWSIWAKVGFSF
ncbi:MAG: hypothetical protein ABIA74_00980 [bacterium]